MSESTLATEAGTETEKALTIRVHDGDNVAIVVNARGLPAGTALADGTVLRVTRGDVIARGFTFEVPSAHGILSVPVPRYAMPRVPKLSAGYWAHEQMDLVDLFVGSEGTLGVITKVLLKLIPKPAAKKTMVATFSQMDKAADPAHQQSHVQRRGDLSQCFPDAWPGQTGRPADRCPCDRCRARLSQCRGVRDACRAGTARYTRRHPR